MLPRQRASIVVFRRSRSCKARKTARIRPFEWIECARRGKFRSDLWRREGRQHKGEDYLGLAAPLSKPFGAQAASGRPSPATGFIGSSAEETFLCSRRY